MQNLQNVAYMQNLHFIEYEHVQNHKCCIYAKLTNVAYMQNLQNVAYMQNLQKCCIYAKLTKCCIYGKVTFYKI